MRKIFLSKFEIVIFFFIYKERSAIISNMLINEKLLQFDELHAAHSI